MATDISAFQAFQSQLKTLCLNEFPCGIGTWRGNNGKRKKDLEKSKVKSHFAVTVVDYGANQEKTETLQELVHTKHSPWNQDYSWSNEAKELRELAVKSPWLIDDKFIIKHFKTLRILDKGVTEVDSRLLHFDNLKELTLSANNIQTVDSRFLPPYLEVLELCANQLTQLDDLCIQPPPLTHLGVGYNLIASAQDFLTGQYWPNLLSLDISHNNIVDLMDTIRKLQTLPKLRNLILQGNPIALIPGYRGYTVDSLKQIAYLDDINISADERHHFKGLAKRKEYILDEAKTVIRVESLKNIPIPEEIKFPDEQPEFPIVTRKYFVRFLFLKDKSSNAEIFQILHDDNFSEPSATQRTDYSESKLSVQTFTQDNVGATNTGDANRQSLDLIIPGPDNSGEGKDHSEPEQIGLVLPEVNIEAASGDSASKRDHGLFLTQESVPKTATTQVATETDGQEGLCIGEVDSDPCLWKEGDLELCWEKLVIRDDLLSLRDFFKEGMQIQIMEEKNQSVPVDQMDGETPPGSLKGGKGGKKKDEKGKDAKKADKGGDDKKKKKKGEPDVEMVDLPVEHKVLASFDIPLKHFTEGEFEYENTFSKDLQEKPQRISSAVSEKKKKPGSAKKKDRAKSPKGDKKDKDVAKGKGGKRNSLAVIQAQIPVPPDEEQPPPPPLEVSISLKLCHWKTAMDCFQTEAQFNEPEIRTPSQK